MTCAPSSGSGKTIITAAIARYHRLQGRRVRVFKTGPDFIDPTILASASGNPVYQLDPWMTGERECRALLYQAAGEADLILVEGVMGLFDGTPSTADLCERLGLPLLLIVDARSMAQTFAAIVLGLTSMRPQLQFAGVIANHVAGEHHEQLLTAELGDSIPYLGAIPRDSSIRLPQRHLGLVEAPQLQDLEQQLDAAATLIADTRLKHLAEPVAFETASLAPVPPILAGLRLGIARDAAFSFIYPANLRCLEALGAELNFFSPLTDTTLTAVDALYFPGGYPELYARELQQNTAMIEAIRTHAGDNKSVLAECGGMLYLMQSLTTHSGERNRMCGLLPGDARMQPRLVKLGMQSLDSEHGQLRGHTFHHSALQYPEAAWKTARKPGTQACGEAIFRKRRVIASYVHWYFPSCPRLIASWLDGR